MIFVASIVMLFLFAAMSYAIVGKVMPMMFQLMADASGWKQLAVKYSSDERFRGTLSRWRSAQFNRRASYGNCLSIGINPDGIYFAPCVSWLFGKSHPPLFIPWRDIEVTETKSLGRKAMELNVANQRILFITSENEVHHIEAHAPKLLKG